jgi:FimV-like protein
MGRTRKRLAILALIGVVASGPASGEEPAPGIRVSGVRVSATARVAIVNDRLVHEGDTIDGARIVAIEPDAVHFELGPKAMTARLGLKAVIEEAPRQAAHAVADARPIPVPQADPFEPEVSDPAVDRPPATADQYGPVRRGETLSEIASALRIEDVTSSQMTVALFEANPEAFGGNVNLLREGAILRLPTPAQIRQSPPASARAEIARQHEAWLAARAQDLTAAPVAPAVAGRDVGGDAVAEVLASVRSVEATRVSDRSRYGPIAYGETLAEIATRIEIGATPSQIMIALFRANPKAFHGNINVLFAGAVLVIPDGDALHAESPDLAAAEVARQMESWRAESLRARSMAQLAAASPPP